jgi:hypothetical protein
MAFSHSLRAFVGGDTGEAENGEVVWEIHPIPGPSDAFGHRSNATVRHSNVPVHHTHVQAPTEDGTCSTAAKWEVQLR